MSPRQSRSKIFIFRLKIDPQCSDLLIDDYEAFWREFNIFNMPTPIKCLLK